MKKMFYFSAIAIWIISALVLMTACSYNPPEGFTKEHHTYSEMNLFAKTIDSKSDISEAYSDTLVKEGSIKYDYREWSAVINGIKCHVSSVTDYVWNNGFLAGEFCKPYYRMDTDYEYYLLSQILSEKQPDWKLLYPENDISQRYNCNHVLSVATPYYERERLTDSELEAFWQEALEINKLYLSYPVQDTLYFHICVPTEVIDVATEEHTVDPNHTLIVYDFSEEGKKEFFKEYKEGWDLLDSGLPIN